MRFLVVTHVQHILKGDTVFAYSPYVREMNLWFKGKEEVVLLAPLAQKQPDAITLPMVGNIRFREVPAFNLRSIGSILATLWKLPKILGMLVWSMHQADHIHLRCPGNMGLLGCLVQIAFPHKKKTAKYAGNWDPDSLQPWSYRVQRWILNSPYLTRNMQVLVYGEWPHSSRNILPFFTASYREAEWVESPPRYFHPGFPVKLLFVGSLLEGKRPLLAIQAVEKLLEVGISAELQVYGDGALREELADYIEVNGLGTSIFLHGNVSAEELKLAYQTSHFLLFPSKSEGWPKAVAEAMSWGCLPITTPVSCVPQMLGSGRRGILISAEIDSMVQAVVQSMYSPEVYRDQCTLAMEWARSFTLERFEAEIGKLV